jgi:hypothetical protein
MKKIGLIILVVVMAMGAIGAGYAAWQQTLNIGGSVNAATFDVNFTTATASTAPTGGTSTAVISVPGPTSGKTATITVTNAYPGYTGTYALTVTNNSSIPVTLALSGPTGDTLNLFSATTNPTGAIAASGTFTYTITVAIPNTWTGVANSGASENVAYTILASQAP